MSTPSRKAASSVLKHFQTHGAACPCHVCSTGRTTGLSALSAANILGQRASYTSSKDSAPDYAFELATSTIRYGRGATAEVGMDVANLNAKKVAVFTDKNLLSLPPVKTVLDSLTRSGINYELYSDVVVEPKDYAVKEAMEWSRKIRPDAFLAVGGGSVMDTAKIANLFTVYKDADLMDFVNAPVGRGLPIENKLLPLIAIPTTAGTGSETTGTAIFDLVSQKSKTGISSRALKPYLGIVDPNNTETTPAAVRASSGLDVLCHSLESYTAIPYNQRVPRPPNPNLRPAYQGANPISDVFSLAALKMCVKHLPRSFKDPEDKVAHENMLLAATLAGVGFGNAGVHLCHGLSYPISSQNPGYKHYGYHVDHKIIPHGVSVAVTSPAVFEFTGASNPQRHLECAEIFGADISNAKAEAAGEILKEQLLKFLHEKLGDQPRGVGALGFHKSQIPELVKGALPQKRVLNLAPNLNDAPDKLLSDALETILEKSWAY